MATRNISIRLSLQDQETVKRGLEKLGAEGQAALKKIEAGSAPASKGLLALNDASRSAQGEMQALAGRLGPLGSALSALGVGGVAAGAALAGLGIGLKSALTAAAEAEKVELRLGAVLKATGNAAGLTKSQMIDYANSLQSSLKINDETLKESIAILSTFRAVSGETFKTGITLAADLAAVFGGDLLSATRQIGLAFQDPTAGMTALRRAGVTFTETQKDLIKSLQESGNLLDAQGIIVDELTRQVGGAAKAEAGGLAGATRGLANEWDDLLEAIGRTEGVMRPAMAAIDTVASALRGISTLFASAPDQTIVALNRKIIEAQDKIASVQKGGIASYLEGRPSAQIENNKKIIADAEKQLELLIKIARAESDAEGAAQSRAKVSAIAAQAGIALEASAQELKKEGEKSAKEAADAAKKAAADKIADLKEEGDLIFRIRGLVEKDVADQEKKAALLPEYIRGLEENYRLAGLTVDAREEELAVIAASKLAVGGLTEADEAHIRAIVRATSAQEAGIEAAKKAAEESARAWEKATDRLKDSITDSIMRGFDEGKPFFKVFLDSLRTTALTSLIQIPVNFAVDAGAGLLRGALGQGGGGGGSGALGMAGNAASILSAATGPSAMLSNGVVNFGLSTGTYGVGTGLSIASAIPYIGAGVAALGILKGLGVIGGGKSVGPNAGGQLIESNGVFAVGPTGADNGGSTAGVISELSSAVEVLNALASGIGVQQIGSGIASFIDTFKAGGIGNAADLIKDAISKGVIEGLTDAERALISSSGDVGATAARIIENRLLPQQLAGQRLQIEDPAKFARDAATAERDGMIARLREIESGTQALADVEFIYQRKLIDIQKQFANSVGDAFTTAIELAGLRLNAANDNLNRASSVLTKAVEAERTGVTNRYNAALKSSQSALDGLTKSAQRLTSITALLKNAIPDIPGQEGASRIAGQATLSAALAAARAGGVLPDEDTLRTALDAVAKPSEQLFSTFLDYQRDFIRTANDISNLSDIADWQKRKADLSVTTAQMALEQDRMAYEAELTRLDGILSGAQAQIDAVNGTTLAVMSIADALNALAAALGVAGAAKTAAGAANPTPGLYQKFLGRAPDKAGEAFYNNEIASGRATSRDVAISIASSPEFAAVNPTLTDLYGAILGRAPDAPGLAYWQAALNGGMSISDIAANFVRDKEYSDLAAVRGYASGGDHPGGLRIVGERGPELEWTGPSRIYSNAQSGAMLDNSAVVAEIKQMRMELNAVLITVAKNTALAEYINRKWDTDGMPPVRAA